MEITARVTADAKVTTLKDEKQVVNFNVAINDSYKPKDSSEVKKIATFIQCAYWINPAIAKYLTKGTLVELYGRIGVNAYKDMQGEPKASLTFHVNNIKLHGEARQQRKKILQLLPCLLLTYKNLWKTYHFKQITIIHETAAVPPAGYKLKLGS